MAYIEGKGNESLLPNSGENLANKLRVVTDPPLDRLFDERTQSGKKP